MEPRVLDRTYHQTREWLRDLEGAANIASEQDAYAALRAVLHRLRDRLTVEEAADLGAQLPTLVRGIYFEGWRPATNPDKTRDKDAFLAGVAEKLYGHEHIDVEEATRTILTLLDEKIDVGETEQAAHMLPKDIKELWPGHPNA